MATSQPPSTAAAPSEAELAEASADADFARVPRDTAAAKNFARELREEQKRLGGGLDIGEAALEAVLERFTDDAASGATSTLRRGGHRHLRAWGRLVLSICNEEAQADAMRTLPLAPPGVATATVPGGILAHRQVRAHDAAVARLADVATGKAMEAATMMGFGIAGVPMETEVQIAIAIDDIEQIDALVRSSLRAHEEALQVDLSDALLTAMVGEVAEELRLIEGRRRFRSPEFD